MKAPETLADSGIYLILDASYVCKESVHQAGTGPFSRVKHLISQALGLICT